MRVVTRSENLCCDVINMHRDEEKIIHTYFMYKKIVGHRCGRASFLQQLSVQEGRHVCSAPSGAAAAQPDVVEKQKKKNRAPWVITIQHFYCEYIIFAQ